MGVSIQLHAPAEFKSDETPPVPSEQEGGRTTQSARCREVEKCCVLDGIRTLFYGLGRSLLYRRSMTSDKQLIL